MLARENQNNFLISEEDKDVENAKNCLLSKGKSTPELDFHNLIMYTEKMQKEYQLKMNSMTQKELFKEARKEGILKGYSVSQKNSTNLTSDFGDKLWNKDEQSGGKNWNKDINTTGKTWAKDKNYNAKKFVPFKRRGDIERGSIRQNERIFAGISNIGSVNRGVRHLVGALSVSNKRSLKLPPGISKLTRCCCETTIHPFMWQCPVFKTLSLQQKINIVKKDGLCRNCLMKHQKECTFRNQHRCPTQGNKFEDQHNQMLCPTAKDKRSIATISIEEQCTIDHPNLMDVLTLCNIVDLDPAELFGRMQGEFEDATVEGSLTDDKSVDSSVDETDSENDSDTDGRLGSSVGALTIVNNMGNSVQPDA